MNEARAFHFPGYCCFRKLEEGCGVVTSQTSAEVLASLRICDVSQHFIEIQTFKVILILKQGIENRKILRDLSQARECFQLTPYFTSLSRKERVHT